MRAVLQPCAGTWNLYFISQDNYRSCHGFTRISRFPYFPPPGECSVSKRLGKKRGGRSEKRKPKTCGQQLQLCSYNAFIMNAAQHVCFPNGSKGGGKQGSRRGHVVGGVMQTTDATQQRSKFYDYTSTQWICEINCKCLQYSMCARLKSKNHTTLQQQQQRGTTTTTTTTTGTATATTSSCQKLQVKAAPYGKLVTWYEFSLLSLMQLQVYPAVWLWLIFNGPPT